MKQFLINPVLNKEFKLRFRSFKTFIGLVAYLLAIGLIVIGFIFMMTEFRRVGFFRPEESRSLFTMLSFLQLALILFITPGLTAGVISGERERQTLNILLTTVQSSTSIILSKLFSSFSYLLLLIISSLPIYSVVFLFGGVSPMTLISVFGFYLFTIIAFASLGVLFSTIIRKTIVSMVTTYGVTLLLAGGTAFFFLIVMRFTQMQMQGVPTTNPTGYFLAMLNPPIVLGGILTPEISEEMYRTTGIHFPLWVSYIIFYSILTLIVLLISICKLRPNMKPKNR
ncbi:ABC transporter permease [Heyndrickxia sp. NPDC080065]|uniref:ABC transporter permease n=1 Tax=Heyndrickxia sp. NPDC080065 TaxID=3390568 RepID=UPI003D004A2F